MKTNLLKTFFAALLLLCSTVASAHDFEVDGIFYDITDATAKTVEVTYKGNSYDSHDNEYSGNVVIPDKVTYNGTSYSVTSIGSSAFYNCSGLTSVTIGNSVTSIGVQAFGNCTGLKSVIIGNSVTSIGFYAFYDCNNLKTVYNLSSLSLYAGYTDYGYVAYYASKVFYAPNGSIEGDYIFGVFSGVNTLCGYIGNGGDIVLPADYKGENYKIGSLVFSGCTGLTSIEIPGSVTRIGYEAFYGCTGLTSVTIGHSVTIGNSVTSIGDSAFRGCTGLTSVTIGHSVTTIGDYAFSNCDGLISIEIPGSVTTIGYYAFYDCDNLDSVTIGNSVTSIGKGAFNDCTGLTSVTIPNSVTTIGDYAFGGCTGLTSIEIPNSVTTIGYDAFEDCTGLTSVTIGHSVTTIGDYAFDDCTGLKSVIIGNSVTSIGSSAFYGCNNLKTVYNLSSLSLYAGYTDYGYVAYYASKVINAPNGSIEGDYIFGVVSGVNTLCEYIGNGGDIVLPADYKGENYKIGSSVFRGCTGLKSVIIGNSVTSIGEDAFGYCSGLTSITIPNSVTTIGASAFYGCTGLTSIEIPNSVTSIGDYAFHNCDGLKSVIIGNSVTTIGYYAFYDCDNLASVTIGNGVKSVGSYAFYGCDGLKSVIIGNSVTSIGDYAFGYCSGLTSITIPNSVTTIGARAFFACYGLTSIEILGSVTSIGSYAFSGCTRLKEIYSLAKTPPTIYSSTFNNYTATLYVPYGTKSAYQAANYWKKFTNIVEIHEFATGDINGDDEVNVGDFATLVNAIFDPENTDKAKYARADVNKDGEVNVGDFAALVNLIFGGSSNAAPKKAAATRATTGEHRLYIEPFNIAPGERTEVAVLMENTGDKFSQMQFDLTLPSGISIVQEFDEELFGDVPLIKHGSRTSSKAYDITCRPEGDGVKIMCATENINAYFLRESGDVLLITVEAAADLAFGTYELTISNSVLARQDDSTYKPASETAEITVCDLTGIDSIEAEDGAAEIYDIYGRRVTEPVKGGVYIINGKKVVVE